MVLKIARPIKINYFLAKHFYRDVEEEEVEKKAEKNAEKGANDSNEEQEQDHLCEDRYDKVGSEEGDEAKLKWFYKKLEDIYEESKRINKKLPLVELIKYYRSDYYYKLAFYMPKLKFKELYFSSLKSQILEQVNNKYVKARNLMIEKSIDSFLKGKTFLEFSYFKIYPDFDYEKMGITYFTNIKSMELLFNYLVYHYNERVRNIIDLSAKAILAQDKAAATNLMMQISAVDAAYVKIQDFDKSLGPDMEDGKRFINLRHGLANDTAYHKMYKIFISQKNKLSQEIIYHAIEAFDNITETYAKLFDSSQLEIKTALAAQYNVGGKTKSFRDFLIDTVENIEYFNTLLSQVMKVESGTTG